MATTSDTLFSPEYLQSLLDQEEIPFTPESPPLYTIPPEIIFDKSHNPFPVMLYIAREDRLLLTIRASIGLASVVFTGRYLFPNGSINAFSYTILTQNDRQAHSTSFAMGEGFLLSLTAQVFAVVPIARGQIYVQAATIRGNTINNVINQFLLQDYVTSGYSPTWPSPLFRESTDGSGFIVSFSNNEPAPGSNFRITVPAGTRWLLHTLTATLTTSVAAGDRFVRLTIRNDVDTILYHSPLARQQPPSSSFVYTFSDVPVIETTGPFAQGPIPPLFPLMPGFAIVSRTTGIQPTDEWSVQDYLVEEWLL